MNLSRFLKEKFFASIVIVAIFAFSSCQDVIYSNIRKEVVLEDSSVEGVVRSITRVSSEDQEYLYITNGGEIFRKVNSGKTSDHSYGGWEKVCSNKDVGSSSRINIMALSADTDYVYAFTASWEENTSKGQNRWNERAIYASADGGKSWEKVPFDIATNSSKTGDDNPALFFFCTNTIAKENRKAYFNYDGNKGYELNGSSAPIANAAANDAASCAYLDGGVKFAPYWTMKDGSRRYYGSASCTNETQDEPATVRYWASGRTLSWDGAVEGTKSAGDYIYSMAVTDDYILVGTNSGIEHYRLNSDKSVGDKESFATNAEAIMSSGYEVNELLVIEPEKNETETAIYAATDFTGRYEQFDHACIWAYYPERGNWNRD